VVLDLAGAFKVICCSWLIRNQMENL